MNRVFAIRVSTYFSVCNQANQSPLYLAVSAGYLEVAKYLVGKGASIAPVNEKVTTVNIVKRH